MNSDILALKEKLDKIKNLGWIECKNKNKSVTGKTLENLLEINPDNFEIPDYNTIEIKSKVSKREHYIDLFCATPDSYVLETKRLYDKYSYLDSNNYKILNFVLYGEFLKPINNEYSAKLRIDYKNKKVIMEIYNKDNELIDNLSSWSFELLEEKLCIEGKVWLNRLYALISKTKGAVDYIKNNKLRTVHKIKYRIDKQKSIQYDIF